ncbi:MAG: MMPL family transporter [Steroidobacterales bacterium]
MRSRYFAIAIWLCLMAIAGLVASHANYTADLSAFLPKAPSKAQRFLIDQLREGPAARLILIDIEGADAATRERLSSELAGRLRMEGTFRSVLNGEAMNIDREREFLVRHRYLLSERVTPAYFTVEGLRSAIGDGIDLLSSSMGLFAADLFVRDPTAETLQVFAQLDQSNNRPRSVGGVWVSGDERRALLIAETRVEGSDSDGQQRAMEAIRRAFTEAQGATGAASRAPVVLRLSGPGVFAVEARATIRGEAIRLSMLSSMIIATFLLCVYRSVQALVLGMLPVVSGALAGVAAVALGFGVVHGVTLGFGVTLIGEAVDYSVYLFIQAQRGTAAQGGTAAWTATLWPTIRLGMLTSVCGFASLLPSAFPGLAQLGLYSIAGLLAAGLATRFVLPALIPRSLTLGVAMPVGRFIGRVLRPIRSWSRVLWLLPLIAGFVLYAHRDHLWNRELSALSPVPLPEQTLDAELRTDLGAPDVRTVVVVTGNDAEIVLQASEILGRALEPLVRNGAIASYGSPSRFLPSLATQQTRRANLPDREEMAARLRSALQPLPIHADRLRPFLEDVEAARTGSLVRRSDLESTSLAAGVDALLVRHGDQWSGLLPLQAPRAGPHAFSVDVTAVRRAIDAATTTGVEATVLDLKYESDALYTGYLSGALRLSLLGFVAILALLLISLRSIGRVFRVIAPLVLAVLAVMTGLALVGQALTILHLIGLLLIIAVGSNYALFFDRESSVADADPADSDTNARMLASLLIANMTTVMGFGILAFSKVPVLAALGMTVAPGTLLALLFSASLSEPPPVMSRSP